MNKSLVIYGPKNGQIDALASAEISNRVGKMEFKIIQAREFKNGYSDDIINKHCKILVDFIIISRCKAGFNYESFMNVIVDGLDFENDAVQGHYNPVFIFVTETDPILTGESWNSRIDKYSTDLHF